MRSLALTVSLVLLTVAVGSACRGRRARRFARDAGPLVDAGPRTDGGGCALGQTLCSFVCVNLDEHPLNCGSCGNACPTGQVCSSGECSADCSSGTELCGTLCVDTLTDVRHCGYCDNACPSEPGSTPVCIGGGCSTICALGTADCNFSSSDGCETDTRTDVTNCGMCERACLDEPGSTATCSGGICGYVCAAGWDDCDGVAGCEANLDVSSLNCGACGRACPAGQSCAARTCTATPSFRVTMLGQSGCMAVDHSSPSGDDRGGIGVSSTQVFYSGDSSTVRISAADLTGVTAIGTIHDGMVTDVADGSVYVLLDAAGMEVTYSGSVTVTQLGRLDGATGLLTATRVPLSTPISLGSGTGIFAGWGRAYFHYSSTWYEVTLPGGAVTMLGTGSSPSYQSCESWAYWGIAEYYGGERYAVYVTNSTTISRLLIPTGTVTTLATFTNLSDMCSISFSAARNRWYFHHEYSSQFITSGSEVVGYCPATWDRP